MQNSSPPGISGDIDDEELALAETTPARQQSPIARCNKAHRETEEIGERKFHHRKQENMIGEVIVIGDLQLRDGASLEEHDRLGERMYNIVSRLPGFLSIKSFKADDGEEVTVFRFASEQALEAWRTHPEHVETMKRGHAEFYASGFLQICRVIREVGPFKHD